MNKKNNITITNDKNPLISIIIPTYNCERFLVNIVDDVLKQTFNDFELIIVNDGSTDNTKSICMDLIKKDNRIKIINQKNGGAANARNNGVIVASGEYVTYLDDDDRINTTYLESMINVIKKYDVDIVCGSVDRVKENYNLTENTVDEVVNIYDKKGAISEMMLGNIITVSSCCKLYKKNLQIKHPFLDGKYSEDLSNSYKIVLESEKIGYTNTAQYHYVMRGGSVTGKRNTTKKYCYDFYEAINLCCNDILRLYPDIKEDVYVLKMRDYMSLYLSINRCEKESRNDLIDLKKEVLTWCRCNCKLIIRNKKTSKVFRVRSLMFSISPTIYEFFYYLAIKIVGKSIS